MRRKVIKQGHNTLTVSLPRKWCTNHSLKEGEEIDVNEKGNNLLISKESYKGQTEITTDITGLDRSTIIILIQSLYTYGYETIILKSKDVKAKYYLEHREIKVSEIINSTINRLMGAEIVSSRNGIYKIQIMMDDSKEKFDTTLRRIFRLLLEHYDIFIERYRKNDIALIDEVEFKHTQIRRFTNYALRILNKYGHEEADKTTYYFSIIRLLIKMNVMIKNLSGPRDKPMKISSKCCDLVKEIRDIFEQYYDSFYKYDLKSFSGVHKNRDLFKDKLYYNRQKLSKDDLYLIGGILQTLELLLDLNELKMAIGH